MSAETTTAAPPVITVVSWNIHSGVGLDRRYRLGRVLRVLADLSPDIVGLQEVDAGYRLPQTVDQERVLRRAVGGYAVAGPTLRRDQATYGNLLLSRWPIEDPARLDLSLPGREPRGAIRGVVHVPGGPVAVHVFHLGLRRWERVQQAHRLLHTFGPPSNRPGIWMGDVNEWRRAAGPLSILRAGLGPSRTRRTFPSAFPLLRLDRLWVTGTHALDRVRAHDRSPAPWCSDHLPLVVRLGWPRALTAASENSVSDTGPPRSARGPDALGTDPSVSCRW